jgi:hypothetical protein
VKLEVTVVAQDVAIWAVWPRPAVFSSLNQTIGVSWREVSKLVSEEARRCKGLQNCARWDCSPNGNANMDVQLSRRMRPGQRPVKLNTSQNLLVAVVRLEVSESLHAAVVGQNFTSQVQRVAGG